jgi:hypothetical protein
VRLAIAVGVVAVTLAAAVAVHGVRLTRHGTAAVSPTTTQTLGASIWAQQTERVSYQARPWWDDPLAVLLAVGGVAIAVGIVARGRSTPSANVV